VRTRILRLFLVAWLVAECSLMGGATTPPPRSCNEMYGTQRCLAMTDVAAAEVGRTRDDVTETTIVPDPPPKDGPALTPEEKP